jgi:hypothetical protein
MLVFLSFCCHLPCFRHRIKKVNSDSHEGRSREKYTVIARNSREHGERRDDRDSTVNKTKYVIAKDGMVVTVEGNDEARAKDLLKVIENELGVKLNQ